MTKEQLKQELNEKIDQLRDEIIKYAEGLIEVLKISYEKKLNKIDEEFELPFEFKKIGNFTPAYFDIKNIYDNKKLYAYIKLQYIADQLNDGWKPDWKDDTEIKFYLYYLYSASQEKGWKIGSNFSCCEQDIYFKSKEQAKKALKIMGEDLEYLK